MAPSISNPRRILAISHADSSNHLSRILSDLSGTPPTPSSSVSIPSDSDATIAGETIAGATHDIPLSTAYYTATIPCWIDLIAEPADWASSFLSEEAREVLSVIGGVVLVFELGGSGSSGREMDEKNKDVIRSVGRVMQEGLGGWEWDGVGLAVGVGHAGEREIDEWDGLCGDVGLEFVKVTGKEDGGRNEFGGIPRVKEALEANDWSNPDALSLSDFGEFEDANSSSNPNSKAKLQFGDDDDKEFDPEDMDFGFDKADFEGLKKAIWAGTIDGGDGDGDGEDGEDDEKFRELEKALAKEEGSMKPGIPIGSSSSNAAGQTLAKSTDEGDAGHDDKGEDLAATMERMMLQLQGVKEAAANTTSEQQRKRMAANAVAMVMRELDGIDDD